ncbi:immunity 17 family protein [Aquimarina rhabdastrellae]
MENISEFINTNPHYGYLIAVGGLGLYLIGLILDWDWPLEPGGGYFNVAYWCEKLGRKTVRILLGIMTTLGLIASLSLFWYYNTLSH